MSFPIQFSPSDCPVSTPDLSSSAGTETSASADPFALVLAQAGSDAAAAASLEGADDADEDNAPPSETPADGDTARASADQLAAMLGLLVAPSIRPEPITPPPSPTGANDDVAAAGLADPRCVARQAGQEGPRTTARDLLKRGAAVIDYVLKPTAAESSTAANSGEAVPATPVAGAAAKSPSAASTRGPRGDAASAKAEIASTLPSTGAAGETAKAFSLMVRDPGAFSPSAAGFASGRVDTTPGKIALDPALFAPVREMPASLPAATPADLSASAPQRGLPSQESIALPRGEGASAIAAGVIAPDAHATIRSASSAASLAARAAASATFSNQPAPAGPPAPTAVSTTPGHTGAAADTLVAANAVARGPEVPALSTASLRVAAALRFSAKGRVASEKTAPDASVNANTGALLNASYGATATPAPTAQDPFLPVVAKEPSPGLRDGSSSAATASTPRVDVAQDAAVSTDAAEGQLPSSANPPDQSAAATARTPVGATAEKTAASLFPTTPAERSGVYSSIGARKNNFLSVGKQSLAQAPREVGTGVATGVDTVSLAPRQLPASRPVDAIFASGETIAFKSGATETAAPEIKASAPAHAADVVREIRDIADGLWALERNSVEVRFHFGESDKLSVRVEYRNGEVHTTFRTESPELRDTLASEWQVQSQGVVADRPYKIADPVFNVQPGAQAQLGGDASRQQQRSAENPDAQTPAPAFSFGRNEQSPTASSSTPVRVLRPDTALHLHALA